jgi:hypothetical protein
MTHGNPIIFLNTKSTFSMAAYELCFLKIKIGIKKALCPGECPLFTGFDGKN